MKPAAITDEIHAFIGDQILFGQAEGLSPTTPLLELGILDSFGLFKLAAHLNERYPVDIKPDQITGSDFRDIDSITQLVVRRLAALSADRLATPPHAPLPVGVAAFESPACAQVFIWFTGLGGVRIPEHRAAGTAIEFVANTPEFFRRIGLGDRNIVLLHDTRGRSYKEGISPDLPTRAAVQDWLQAWVEARPHLEEIYTIGVSDGGPMAMLTGDRLHAKAVWAFAPGTARGKKPKEVRAELDALMERVTGKLVTELARQMTPDEIAQIDANVTPAIIDGYYRALLDPATVLDTEQLAEIVGSLTPGNGITEHRLYYVPEAACDAVVADMLGACPRVTRIPLAPSDAPEPTWPFSRWVPPERWIMRNHLVVDLLRARGMFDPLFPPCREASSTVAAV
jgi:clorobiocin biosynthesis protein CloN5